MHQTLLLYTSRIFNQKFDQAKILILIKKDVYSSVDFDLTLY